MSRLAPVVVAVALKEGRFVTTYLLSDGQVLAFFGCWANERPEDGWLALAETFEFLPAEA